VSTWAGHRARWRGEEYPVALTGTLDGLEVRLRSAVPGEAFTEVAEGVFVHQVPARECDVVLSVRTVGTWRGHEVVVLDDRDDQLLVEDLDGSWTAARAAGFDRVARGVWRRWAPRVEVRGLREDTTVLERPDG
jgi:hypothetical protein